MSDLQGFIDKWNHDPAAMAAVDDFELFREDEDSDADAFEAMREGPAPEVYVSAGGVDMAEQLEQWIHGSYEAGYTHGFTDAIRETTTPDDEGPIVWEHDEHGGFEDGPLWQADLLTDYDDGMPMWAFIEERPDGSFFWYVQAEGQYDAIDLAEGTADSLEAAKDAAMDRAGGF